MDQSPSYNLHSGVPPTPPPGDGRIDWEQAEQYLRLLFRTYQHQIASSMDHINEKILPLMKKIHDGERSQHLYKEILSLSSPPPDGNSENGHGSVD